MRFAVVTQERDDARVHPVEAPVPGTIADLAMPDGAAGDGGPHLPEEVRGMMAGVHHAMILSEQFLAGILADRAEPVVGVGDPALAVGDGHDGMLVEGKLLVLQVAPGGVRSRESFVQGAGQAADLVIARGLGPPEAVPASMCLHQMADGGQWFQDLGVEDAVAEEGEDRQCDKGRGRELNNGRPDLSLSRSGVEVNHHGTA